jgi:cysteine desulfurase
MWQKNVRYLDYNASSSVTPFVKDQLIQFLGSEDNFLANPSSRHRLGQQASQLLYQSRMQIAGSLGVDVSPEELIFTSSGTEANQTIIRSMIREVDGFIMGSGEHAASYDLLAEIPQSFLHELALLRSGNYDLRQLQILLSLAKESGLKKIGLSLFWANNETGVITPLDKLKEVIDQSGISVLLHLDGCQVWGKIPFDVKSSGASYVSFSSHKIGAPAGVGLIWKKPGAVLHPLIPGSQSFGFRGGTENSIGIFALSAASSEIDPEKFVKLTLPLQMMLEEGLSRLPEPVLIWGSESVRVSNTTRFSILNFKSYENWVELLDLQGFAVSHGSACKSRVIEPSRVLLKMGAHRNEALNSLRVSFGPSNTEEDVALFLGALNRLLLSKRGQSQEAGISR